MYNSAKRNATKVVNFLNEEIPKEGLTLRDLHRIKNDLYDIGYQSAGAKEGTQAEVARGTAEQINNYLRGISPDYAKYNDQYSLITNIERGLDNENTIAKKIKNIGNEQSILSGTEQRLKNIDILLPKHNKFYKQAQELNKSEDEINNIRKLIDFRYERNPKLLGNRNDEAFEQALNDLQNKTDVRFMEELNNLRARDALERFTPGQGGGSGSSQGYQNLLRSGITTTTGGAIGGLLGGPAGTLGGLITGAAAVSPKFMGKGTIKNIGALYKALNQEVPSYVLPMLINSYKTVKN